MNFRQRHSKWYGLIICLVIPIIGLLACSLPQSEVHTNCACEEGAFPSELTTNYQSHYLAMVIDSYILHQHLEIAQERLKTFTERDKIQALGERSAAYAKIERTEEAQLVNDLAATLSQIENWQPKTIESVVAELIESPQYQGDDVKKQALSDFSSQLIGVTPVQ